MSGARFPRRRFLGSATALGLLVSAPVWIRDAFAENGACVPSLRGIASLGSAFRRAHASGKKLLVFVIPEADETKYDRGSLLGAWLNHGTDAELAALSLCELACATMKDLRRLVPGTPPGEPLMVLLDPSKLGSPGVPIDPVVPALVLEGMPSFDEKADFDKVMRERERIENSAWNARIAVVARSARLALAPGVRFPNEAAAAADARSRWVESRVPGSHWASSSGCGTEIEGVESNVAIGCGMGHVPEKARRFLYLFARSPYAEEDLPP